MELIFRPTWRHCFVPKQNTMYSVSMLFDLYVCWNTLSHGVCMSVKYNLSNIFVELPTGFMCKKKKSVIMSSIVPLSSLMCLAAAQKVDPQQSNNNNIEES